MGSLILSITFILAADSFRVFGQAVQLDEQLQSFDPTQVDAFKTFLQESLSSGGTSNRYILISTGILPAPTNYATQREFASEMSTEQPLFDYEHFKHYIDEILASEERINEAIYKLFSVGEFKDRVLDSETANSISELTSNIELADSTADSTQSDFLNNYSSDVYIVNLDPDQQTAFKNTQYEVISETSSDSDETTSATLESKSFNTEYIKFLTNDHSESLSTDSAAEDQCTTGTVFLENDSSDISTISKSYEQFLKPSSNSIGSKTYDTDENEDYSTAPEYSAAYDTGPTESYSTDSSLSSESTNLEESSFSSSDETYVGLDTSDYVSLKLWPTSDERLEETSFSSEDFTYTTQNTDFEDTTENQKIQFQTTETDTKVESIQTESEESSSPSMREAKEIRQNESEDSSSRIDLVRGTSGINYPNYEDIPDNEFSCKDKTHIPGFYADKETLCQVFHVCWPGRRESFLCPIGTTFNQAILACDYWYNSNCSVSSAYFDVNAAFKEVDTAKSGMTGPMIDTLIKDTKNKSVAPDEVISSSGEISELYEADVHFSETVAKHELSKIWKFLPIKAKIFIEPQLKLEDAILKTKLKRSKKGILEERDKENGRRDEVSKVRKLSKENIESILFQVLNLIQS